MTQSEPERLHITAEVAAWLVKGLRFFADLAAQAGRKPVPESTVHLVAGLRGPRVRMRHKDTKEPLPALRTPYYLIPPLSTDHAKALGFGPDGQPLADARRYMSVSPRYTLDRTWRGMIDMAFGEDLPRDTTKVHAVSKRLFVMLAHHTTSLMVPPRPNWRDVDGPKMRAVWQARPDGWTEAAAVLGLSDPVTLQGSSEGGKVDGEKLFATFMADAGPFPLSGLGAFDNAENLRPKQYCLAILPDGTLATDKEKPGKVRVPSWLFAIIEQMAKDGKPFVVTLQPHSEVPEAKPAPEAPVGLKAAIVRDVTAAPGRSLRPRKGGTAHPVSPVPSSDSIEAPGASA